ncbi:MAG TPA: hypothetical protein VNN73_13265 [Blastocatellia bacterium]|nr:hypothetical protein [Blastocatellia bacterium]
MRRFVTLPLELTVTVSNSNPRNGGSGDAAFDGGDFFAVLDAVALGFVFLPLGGFFFGSIASTPTCSALANDPNIASKPAVNASITAKAMATR